jgi:arginyl-tRNA synthetase
MVYLPEGRMKSREGKIVDADTLLDEVKNLAKAEIKKREPKIKKTELNKRSEIISQAAIKFFLLNRDPLKDFTYNPEESMSFEGDTGPYVQYSYARAKSILRKAKNFKASYELQEGQELAKLLEKFPQVIQNAASKYKTQYLTNYLLNVSKKFNEFYHKNPVLRADIKTRNARLTLIKATSQVIKNGLNLLGIEILEKM